MSSPILGILNNLVRLGVLTAEEKHRYEDNILKARRKWYEEYDKLETEDGSDSALDDIELELRLLDEALEQAVRTKNPSN